ncbi:MAG: hypothetical protein I3J02_10975 [Prevotella sp.]|nr:hypothetical protein [Prevotella sp.]
MSVAELKYAIFKDVDSIEDESLLTKIAAYIREKASSKKAYPQLWDAETGDRVNEDTMRTIEDAELGKGLIDCGSYEDYLNKVGK